jgi:hypothetical protein
MSRPSFVRCGHPDRTPHVIYEDNDDLDYSTGFDFDMKLTANPSENGDGDSLDGRDANNDINIIANPTGDDPTPPQDGLVLGGGQTIKLMLVPDKPPAPASAPAKEKKPHPQAKMKKFWTNFDPEYTGKVTRVLPDRITDKDLSAATLAGEIAHKAIKSYEDAKESCIRDVKRIIKECRAANQKYTDSHWDIERDLKITRIRDCLDGLATDDDRENPADAKRVTASHILTNAGRNLWLTSCRTFSKTPSST